MQEFRSNGKILLTGEYAVLDGAKSLALPTTKGQTLKVSEAEKNLLSWKSFDENNKNWFEAQFHINEGEFELTDTSTNPVTERLQQILKQLYKTAPEKFYGGLEISTHLDFKRNWGLGTSSTLINNLAQWINTDPYQLLKETFGGSGYDIAAAQNDHPITYQLTKGSPSVFIADFNPEFSDELFFVYLNKKQNSRDAIAHYRKQNPDQLQELLDKISGITEQIISSNSLTEFKMLLQAHETLISKSINLPRIQTQLSLGAWGGDFVLATGKEKERDYFRQKGYQDILEYNELIK
jgi:mevalonate kinase